MILKNNLKVMTEIIRPPTYAYPKKSVVVYLYRLQYFRFLAERKNVMILQWCLFIFCCLPESKFFSMFLFCMFELNIFAILDFHQAIILIFWYFVVIQKSIAVGTWHFHRMLKWLFPYMVKCSNYFNTFWAISYQKKNSAKSYAI